MNPGGPCRIHNNCPIIPILNQINPVCRNDKCFFKISSNIILPSTSRPSYRCLSCRFTCYTFESTPTFFHSGYTTCPSYLIDLIALTILGKRKTLSSYWLWNLLHSHSHPSWAQIFASGSCFQILLTCILEHNRYKRSLQLWIRLEWRPSDLMRTSVVI